MEAGVEPHQWVEMIIDQASMSIEIYFHYKWAEEVLLVITGDLEERSWGDVTRTKSLVLIITLF